jgi:hypothetical protein
MKFEKLRPGMRLFDVGRQKMGKSTVVNVSVWSVEVISVDFEKRIAVVSWNGANPRTYYEGQIARLREKEPMLVKSGFGLRLATREEQKAARAAQKGAA